MEKKSPRRPPHFAPEEQTGDDFLARKKREGIHKQRFTASSLPRHTSQAWGKIENDFPESGQIRYFQVKEHIPSDGSLKSGHLRKTISFLNAFKEKEGRY